MLETTHQEKWTEIIAPESNLLDLKLREVWKYRDLLVMFVRRDFVATYKQTILGPIWFFIQPILTTLTFTFIFGRIAGLSTDGKPMILFYMAGITLWNYFSECLNKTATVFRDNANIFGKVYFPRLVMPLSIVLSNIVRLGIQFGLFLVFWGYYYFFTTSNVQPHITILLLPLLVVLLAALALGFGMIISAMTTKYRDLIFLLTFGVQLLMYATPIIYPLSSIGENYRWLIQLNPLTSIIETFRYGFLGSGVFNIYSLCYTTVFTLITLGIGTIVFNKVERGFMDTV
jgi:lipopolysaccharide transport system permease protein